MSTTDSSVSAPVPADPVVSAPAARGRGRPAGNRGHCAHCRVWGHYVSTCRKRAASLAAAAAALGVTPATPAVEPVAVPDPRDLDAQAPVG